MGFFDNLSKKATETYKNTTDKTSRMAREMKLKSYINENKNKIEKVYTEIGRKVHEMYVRGNTDEIREHIKPELEEIEAITKKIDNMNNEIRAINNIKLCDKCFAEIGLNAKFCPQCGAVQEEKVEVVDNKAIENVVAAEPVTPTDMAKAEAEVTTETEVPAQEEQITEEPVQEEVAQEQVAEQPTIEENVEPPQEENDTLD